ncbi:hypothetical protein BC941DRAFT_450336 [Chlamydoabsidia padenii]|nr:hypothetical protein BC941DRAFT_450336 [Chlamydoabsidia padenii]
MAKGKRDNPTRKERRAQKKQVLSGGDDDFDLDAQLKKLGLTTKCITGDGNCLFRALSDQYYGYDKHHRSIRREVCEYLGQHKDTYQYFVEDDIPFDQYLSSMEQDGCFGGHMVIVGFAKLRRVDVKIYQPGMIYVINGVDDEDNQGDEEDTDRQVLHIAYHSWEHYSSIRNIDGPYSGMPEIKDKDTIPEETATATIDDDDDGDDDSPDSKEKVILNACPGTSIRKIRRLLRKHKGDPDKVIDALYESDNTAINENTNGNIEETPIITTTETTGDIENSVTVAMDDQPGEQVGKQPSDDDSTAILPQVNTDHDNKKASPPPTKRLTGREKKLQAKMRQKELQREKKQQLANKHAAKSRSNDTPSDGDEPNQAMKQLHI